MQTPPSKAVSGQSDLFPACDSSDQMESPLFNYRSEEDDFQPENQQNSDQQEQPSKQNGGSIRRRSCTSETDDGVHPERVRYRRKAFSDASVEEMSEQDFPDADRMFQKTPGDVRRIMQQIRPAVLFKGYDYEELKLVADYMYIQRVAKGDTIVKTGGTGYAFYTVKSGEFLCTVPGKDGLDDRTVTYKGNGYFGELELLKKAPRAATITASTDGELWVLSALRYSWLRKRRAMLNAERFEKVIRAIPLFRDNLDPSLINRLIDAIEVVNLAPGDVICREGEPGDAMYFIMAGEVEATISGVPVTNIVKNGFFGERALVLDEGRAATCRVTKRSKLAKLPKESFALLIPDNVIDKMKRHIAVSYGGVATEAAAADNLRQESTI